MKHYKNKSEENNKKIKEYLSKDEIVLANYKNFYATNRRLIRISRDGFLDVAYEHITTIEYTRYRKIRGLIIGILFVFIGIGVLVPGQIAFLHFY